MKTFRFIVEVNAETLEEIDSVTVWRVGLDENEFQAHADIGRWDIEGKFRKGKLTVLELVTKEELT